MIDLRKRTYEILGLEIGSLSNEGGRDWNEAEAEAKVEIKESNTTTKEHIKVNIKEIIYSKKKSDFGKKAQVAKDEKLSKEEVKQLLRCNDKDVIMDLLRFQNIEKEDIEKLRSDGTFLVKKYINENNL